MPRRALRGWQCLRAPCSNAGARSHLPMMLPLSLWMLPPVALAVALLLPRDRAIALWLKAREDHGVIRVFKRITDFAEGWYWLAGSGLVFLAGSAAAMVLQGPAGEAARLAAGLGLAVLAAIALGAAILHTFKLFVGRVRPRDLFRSGAYGFSFFGFDVRKDSFPSGHAQTICAVATVFVLVWPWSAIVAVPVAVALSASRFIVTAHYASDVCMGMLIGVAGAEAALLWGFPELLAR